MMNNKAPTYQGIKVNLITGFLGAGKTTLIKHLLTQIPEGENWAVLVNEFGEVGLDKDLLESDLHREENKTFDSRAQLNNIAIKQVAGGCLCCTTSAAFQVSLNTLIKTVNPDRILIEPTGLGHPKNILKQLQASHYQSVLLLDNVLCLLDARNLRDERYLNHVNFIEQIAMADIIVASKTELYSDNDWDNLKAYTASMKLAKKPLEKSTAGQLDSTLLTRKSDFCSLTADLESSVTKHLDHAKQKTHLSLQIMGENDQKATYHFKASQGEMTLAWVFDPEMIFDQAQVETGIEKLQSLKGLLRFKGTLRLQEQSLLLNTSPYDQELRLTGKQSVSKIELILSSDEASSEDLSIIKAEINALFFN